MAATYYLSTALEHAQCGGAKVMMHDIVKGVVKLRVGTNLAKFRTYINIMAVCCSEIINQLHRRIHILRLPV